MHGMRREYDDDEDDGRRVGAFQQQNGDEWWRGYVNATAMMAAGISPNRPGVRTYVILLQWFQLFFPCSPECDVFWNYQTKTNNLAIE
jgi:hypothetical protein